MYTYVYICIHTCTHMHTCIHMGTHVYIHVYIHLCTHTVYMYLYVHICIHMYTYVCTYVCVHMYTTCTHNFQYRNFFCQNLKKHKVYPPIRVFFLKNLLLFLGEKLFFSIVFFLIFEAAKKDCLFHQKVTVVYISH